MADRIRRTSLQLRTSLTSILIKKFQKRMKRNCQTSERSNKLLTYSNEYGAYGEVEGNKEDIGEEGQLNIADQIKALPHS